MPWVVFVFGQSLRAAWVVEMLAAVSAMVIAAGEVRGQGVGNTCQPRWVAGMGGTDRGTAVENFILQPSGEVLIYGSGLIQPSMVYNVQTFPAGGSTAFYSPTLGKFRYVGLQTLNGAVEVPSSFVSRSALGDGTNLVCGYLRTPSPFRLGLFEPERVRVTPLPITSTSSIQAIVRLSGGDLLVGGSSLVNATSGQSVGNLARLNVVTGAVTSVPTPGLSGGFAAAVFWPLDDGTILISAPTFGGLRRFWPATNTVTTFAQQPSGISGDVASVVKLPNGELLIGGARLVGNAPVSLSNVARYSPSTSTLTPVGNGLALPVRFLAPLPGGDLIAVTKYFNSENAQSSGADRIWRFYSASGVWSELVKDFTSGPAAPASINAVLLLPNHQLLIGGRFKRFAGAIAEWGLAQLSLCTCSVADIASIGGAPGGEGQLTSDDLIAFLSAFAGRRPVADIATRGGVLTPDGQFTADDVIAFLSAYFQGCR